MLRRYLPRVTFHSLTIYRDIRHANRRVSACRQIAPANHAPCSIPPPPPPTSMSALLLRSFERDGYISEHLERADKC